MFQHDVICVSDEVYEWMVYEGQEEGDGSTIEHVRMATLEGMWDRTLTVCSAGKTFNTTGRGGASICTLNKVKVNLHTN